MMSEKKTNEKFVDEKTEKIAKSSIRFAANSRLTGENLIVPKSLKNQTHTLTHTHTTLSYTHSHTHFWCICLPKATNHARA